MVHAKFDDGILDIGNAFFFADQSEINRLRIDIESRMRVITPDFTREYILLAPHQRENTWADDGEIFSGMVTRNLGASEITFILDTDGGDSLISRRFQNPLFFRYMHQVVPSPYGAVSEINRAPASRVTEIRGYGDLLAASKRGSRILGVAYYQVEDSAVCLDFSVRVLNINPKNDGEGRRWQVATSRVPLYLGGGVEGIRNGHLAFSRFSGDLQFVYLDTRPTWRYLMNDFNRTVNFKGRARLFERQTSLAAAE